MAVDVSMSSDDDKPLVSKSGPSIQNGHSQNGHVVSNGNEHAADDSSLSEDDDMPLVSLFLVFHTVVYLIVVFMAYSPKSLV